MNGFVEERLSKLNVNRKHNLGLLLACGLFILYVGLGMLVMTIRSFGEDGVGVSLAILAVSLVPLAIGVLLVRLFVKRRQRKKAAEADPYLLLDVFGTDEPKAHAAGRFNEEYAQQKLLFENFDKTLGRGFWLTEGYVLSDVGLRLELGALSSVAWIYANKEVTFINKRRYECINFALFFPSGDTKPRCIHISCDEKVSGQVGAALESRGLSFSEDKKLYRLATSDWQAFQQEQLGTANA